MSPLFFNLMKKIVRGLDPRLEKYRARKAVVPYVPSTKAELIQVLARTPKDVLGVEERNIIASAMSFSSKPVSSIMLPRSKITFVHENDFLGPLTLSRLYESGFEHFPVVGASGRIIGLLHTRELNSLRIKETDRAVTYLDENVYYVRDDHTLEMALAAFLRTNCHFFIVIDRSMCPVGLVTYEMLASVMLGKTVADSFDGDLNPGAVARRER